MRNIKKVTLLFMPILIGLISYFGINTYLDIQINKYMKEKDINKIASTPGENIKYKGTIFNSYFANNDGIIIQGSSELTANLDQMPTKIFPTKELNKQVEIIGRGYVQNLQHTSVIGSISFKEGANTNMVSLQSFQWYTYGGISADNYKTTFSPVQYYKYLNNNKISKENKIKYTQRVNTLISGSKQYMPEYINSKLYYNDNLCSKIGRIVLKPYFILRESMVQLKEKVELYKEFQDIGIANENKAKELKWEEEEKKAEEQGKVAITNNDLGIKDEVYDNLKNDLDKYRNSGGDIDYKLSYEFQDFELYLDTCLDLGIKPYIILMPTNGIWYDFTGSTGEKRQEFYNKAEELAVSKGFDVLNLFDDEYTEYFMVDTQHLGWKGWIKVDKEINNYFKR